MFKKAYFAVMRELHLRPIIGTSFLLGGIGSLGFFVPLFTGYRHSNRAYVDDRHKPDTSTEYIDRELQFEFHSILTTDPSTLADHRLEVYKRLGTVKKYHDQLQNSQHLNQDDIDDLKKKFRSAAYNVYYEFLEKNYAQRPVYDEHIITLDQKKERFYKEHDLPYPPEPITPLALPDLDERRTRASAYFAQQHQL